MLDSRGCGLASELYELLATTFSSHMVRRTYNATLALLRRHLGRGI